MQSFSPSPIAAELDNRVEAIPDADAGGAARRVRLLLLTDTSILTMGGSERFLRNLVAGLPQDYQITVMQLTKATRAWSDTSLPVGIQHVRLCAFDIGAIYGPRGWRALRDLRRLVRNEHYDIIQSQHEKSDLLNALLPRCRGALRISNRRDMGFNKSSRLRLLFRYLNHRFDCVVAPAQQILGGLVRDEKLALSRMLWIPNGVDTCRFRPLPQQLRAERRRQLGLADDAVAFGCVASLSPVKRHVDLIDAFAILHANVPQARLLLIGDGPLRSTVAKQVARLGLENAVSMLGNLPDVEGVLPALDVAMLASSSEGMSNAILEAMACGLPIIATGVGGNLQLVRDGATGLLIPAHDPAAMASAMLAMSNAADMRRRMGEAARARIEQEFSLDSMVRAFDRLYRRMLGGP